MSSLTHQFHQSFDVVTGNDHGVTDSAFRLRYQVYCLETGFEDSTLFEDEREQDAFDAWSVHGVIKHRSSANDVATVRLVKANAAGDRAAFPIEERFPGLLLEHGLDERVLPRHLTAEISRFAVSKLMKRRTTDAPDTPSGVSEAVLAAATGMEINDRRSYPLVTFGLFLALIRLSLANDILHWVAVMEPPLLRLLGRFGIQFVPINGIVEYHGQRQPCYGHVTDVLASIYATRPDLWHLITDSGSSSFETHSLAPD